MDTQSYQKAVNPETSPNPDGFVENRSTPTWRNWLGVTDLEQLSTRWGPIQMKNKTIHTLWIATACLFVLIGVIGFFGLVVPMEKQQITKQLHRLVGEIGAVIETRSVVMGASTNDLRKRDLLSMTSSGL